MMALPPSLVCTYYVNMQKMTLLHYASRNNSHYLSNQQKMGNNYSKAAILASSKPLKKTP